MGLMQPVALNTISPDTGLNIKGVTDDLPELLVHLHRAGDLHGDLHRRRRQLPGTVGARSLR